MEIGRITVAFAGFAIICGLVLVMAGPTNPQSPAQRRQTKLEASVDGALDASEQMSAALEKGNLGEVRDLNRQIQEHLIIVRHETVLSN
jgi:hypothetical protein